MRASVGDHVRVRSGKVSVPDRSGVIVEVRGPDGGPPFMVRWEDDGHESLVFPGPDAIIDRRTSESQDA